MRRSVCALTSLVVVVGLITAFGITARAATCSVRSDRTGAAYPTLQAAVDDARSGDVLRIRGICTGHTVIGSEGEDLTLALRGISTDGAPVATLDARGRYRVLTIRGRTDLRIVDLTITGGNAATVTHTDHLGGGIYKVGGTLILAGSTSVTGNQARIGGGIYQYRGTLILTGSASVTDNTWYPAPGHGGCYGGGIRSMSGTVVLKDSSLVARNATKTIGGGIVGGNRLVMRGSAAIRGNTAMVGGGVSVVSGAQMWLFDSASVTRNVATRRSGGISAVEGVYVCSDLVKLSPNDPDDPPETLPCP